MRSVSRPDNYTPTQWNEMTQNGILGQLGDWGRGLSKEYTRYYDPDSVKGVLYSLAQSSPEMLADIGASAVAGTAVAPLLGTTGGAIVGVARKVPKLLSWGEKLKRAYQAENRAGKFARAITPSARATGAVPTVTLLEATSEGQRAMDEYIQDAKENGTYVPDQTEYEAENLRKRVTRDNAGLIGGTNALEYALAFSPATSNLKRFKRLLGAAGLEGMQELGQNKIPKIERGEEWTIGEKGDLGTFAAGAIMGGGFNAAGQYIESRKKSKGNQESESSQNYSGENGKGEGKYWRLQHDGVSYEGARPETMNAMNALGKWYYDKTGKPLIITSVTDGHSHAKGEHSHGTGWKFDINDNDNGALGTITTTGEWGTDKPKGTLADELIKFGQSIGLGMNWEGNHIDVDVSGYQWEGEHKGKNFGGFNPKTGNKQTSKSNFSDPNFSEKENRIWQMAQKASDYLYGKTGFNISPEMFYRQWIHETGNLSSELVEKDHNYGGLTYAKIPTKEELLEYDPNLKNDADFMARGMEVFNQPENGGKGKYRHYKSDEDYYKSFIDDFIIPRINRGELTSENVKTIEDYVNAMSDSGYFTGSIENYYSGMKGAKIPSTRGYSENIENDESEEKNSETPFFDLNAEDETTKKLYEEFVFDKHDSSKSEESTDAFNFFDKFINDDGEFQNTKENRKELGCVE